MNRDHRLALPALLLLALSACAAAVPAPDPRAAPKRFRFEIVKAYPHDPAAYTQGLLWWEGVLYESTGQYGESTLRKVDLETGKVLQKINLDPRIFGEGLALLGDKLFQLTWEAGLCFVYDRASFRRLASFTYASEGWGLAVLGKDLVMSDGSSVLTVRDPESFDLLRRIRVEDDRGPVYSLNELEVIDGEIYANVYQTDRVVLIDPESGRVKAEVDFSGLLPAADHHPTVDVLNGIAWDAKGKRLFVTGKNWPRLFQVKLVPAAR
ncbi:MAG: glutaminyl-peptide cyclotransferase [Candidatus Aminicenantes bacterium]|nr:glutaminyl-peptide cyclotransferase [Candidatus Aminicenantes bacterium]